MTIGTTPPEQTLDMRRRRLKFRAWHRGMREVDLLLGRYADAHVDGLGPSELAGFEALLDIPDGDLLAWITGQSPIPILDDSDILRRIAAFYQRSP
jgi:antitoxin CptB